MFWSSESSGTVQKFRLEWQIRSVRIILAPLIASSKMHKRNFQRSRSSSCALPVGMAFELVQRTTWSEPAQVKTFADDCVYGGAHADAVGVRVAYTALQLASVAA